MSSKHNIKLKVLQVQEMVNKAGKILSKSIASYNHDHELYELGDLDLIHKKRVQQLIDDSGAGFSITVEKTNPVDAESGDVNIMPTGKIYEYDGDEWVLLGELDLSPTFVGKILVVDSTNGNDLTAKKGSFEYRYKSFGYAYSVAAEGDTIIALNGDYVATSNIGTKGNLTVVLHDATLSVGSTIALQDNKTMSFWGNGNSKIIQPTSLSNIFSITGKQNAILNIENIDIYDNKTGKSGLGSIRIRDTIGGCKVNLKNVDFYTKSCPIFSSNITEAGIYAKNVRTFNYSGSTLLNNIVIAMHTKAVFDNCSFEGYSESDITSNYQYGGLVAVGPFVFNDINVKFKNCEWNDLGALAGLVITQNQANITFEGTNIFKSKTAANSILKLNTTVTGDTGNSIAVDLAGEVTYNKPIGYNGVDDGIVFNRLDTTDNSLIPSSLDATYHDLTEAATVTIPCSGRLVTNCNLTQTNANPIIQLAFPDIATIRNGATGRLVVNRNTNTTTWLVPPSGHYVAAGALNWANIGSGSTAITRIQDDVTPPAQARFTLIDHGLVTGDNISISGFTGAFTGYNKEFYVIRIDDNTFELDNTSYIPGATTGSPVFVKNIKVFNTGLEYSNNTIAQLEWEYTGSIFRWSVLRVLQEV